MDDDATDDVIAAVFRQPVPLDEVENITTLLKRIYGDALEYSEQGPYLVVSYKAGFLANNVIRDPNFMKDLVFLDEDVDEDDLPPRDDFSIAFVATANGENPPWGHDRTCPICGQVNLPLHESEPPGLSFIKHCGSSWLRGPVHFPER